MTYYSGSSFIRPYLNCRNDSFVRISEHSIRLIEQLCTEMKLSEHTLGSDNRWVTILIVSAPQMYTNVKKLTKPNMYNNHTLNARTS